ncbi:MAG: PspC domain-containing protein [Pseudomonadota bacterium]|nr:PspC domain-containing protein [Pseudomonadota bacterium]
MARRKYRYSLDRHDAKLAGVCSKLGDKYNVDPTFVRIGFLAAFFLISWEFALFAYAAIGIYLSILRKREVDAGAARKSEFERMNEIGRVKPTVHAMRNDLDETDRRLMAIDHHLSTPNDELAREIEALREEK